MSRIVTHMCHTFFVIAAWYLCGLLGAPTYALRPELAQEVGRNGFHV